MEEKQLIANRIQTPDGTILWSRFGHDYVRYTDKNGVEYMVDGGNGYQRSYDERKLPEEKRSKNLCVFDDAPWEVQREVRLRGTSDSTDGHRIWVPLAKLSDQHLVGIYDYNNENCMEPLVNLPILKEMEYRRKHKIVIEDHDYGPEAIDSITKA